jgi:hypothetical protein
VRQDELDEPVEHSRRRGGRFELFYFEQNGSRTNLKFTRLTVFLIASLTVLSILLLFVLFLSNRRGRPEEVDINVVAPTATPQDYNKPVLQPAPPGPMPPKVIKPPRAGVPPSPSPTPSPTPARTPP